MTAPGGAGAGMEGPGLDIRWEDLRSRALEVAARAHAPYSGLRVGAAGLSTEGRVVAGCNVENASYGLSLCAECGVVSALRSVGGRALGAISVVDGDGRTLMPCGRCRQLLLDHGGPTVLVDQGPGHPPRRLGDLLPDAFGPDDLPGRGPRT